MYLVLYSNTYTIRTNITTDRSQHSDEYVEVAGNYHSVTGQRQSLGIIMYVHSIAYKTLQIKELMIGDIDNSEAHCSSIF